jgi:DNA invertase Pin-like site-specific DNA recombinase
MERERKAKHPAAVRAAAQASGRMGGWPRTHPEKVEHARILYLYSDKTAADTCRAVGIGRRTLFNGLAHIRQRANIASSP